MSHLPASTFAIAAFIGIGITPVYGLQMPGMQTNAAPIAGQMGKALDAGMARHQSEMELLASELDASYRAIASARDPKGYVRDKALFKAHEAEIKAFRHAIREHKQLLGNLERQFSQSSEQEDAMVDHQREMKRVLHTVLDSFETLEYTNEAHYDPNYEPATSIEEAFDAHRAALKELADTIAQHKSAIEQSHF